MNIPLTNLVSLLAIDADKYIEIYQKYEEYFSNFSMVTSILRSLGWLILKGLLSAASMLNTLLDKIFDFINFLDSDEVIRFFNTVKPFIWTVLLFALVYLAYCYLYAHEKPKGVITNILLFAGTVMILPYMMTQMNQFVTYGEQVLSSNIGENRYELLVPYITDLVYLDSIDFDSKQIKSGKRNGFTEKSSENIRYIDINEVVDPGDYDDLKNKNLFKKQVRSQIKKGVDELEVTNIKKDKFFFKDTTPYYYRYHVNFFIAMIYLAALILVMGFSSIKLVQLVYELAAEKIMAPFIAAGDLTGGQKIRKALIGILNGYITILCVLFLQKLFILSTEFINRKTWSDNGAANGCIKAVMIVAGALFIIDGPNFFEQIFGVDAGLKSVGQALQSAYYVSQMAGGINRAITGAVGKVGGAIGKTAGKAAEAAGMLQGMKDGGIFPSNNEQVSQNMAMPGFGQSDIDPGHALGAGEPDGSSELPGGGQPELSGGNTGASAGQKNGSPSSGSSQGKDTGVPGGDGKQNLAGGQTGNGADNNADVNNAINDALNNASADGMEQGGSAGQDVKDNDNLAGWAMRNTRAGRYLSGSYEKGKSFGHAAANSINNRRRKKENKASDIPEPPNQMNRDNLKQ